MLEIINIEGKGFKPLKDYNGWRVAQLGYDESINSLKNCKTLGRHPKTDEVFMIIQGEAFIITAGIEDEITALKAKKIEKNKLYVVKEKQWHAAVLKPRTKLLIIENRPTEDTKSDAHLLTEDEMMKIKKLISHLINQ